MELGFINIMKGSFRYYGMRWNKYFGIRRRLRGCSGGNTPASPYPLIGAISWSQSCRCNLYEAGLSPSALATRSCNAHDGPHNSPTPKRNVYFIKVNTPCWDRSSLCSFCPRYLALLDMWSPVPQVLTFFLQNCQESTKADIRGTLHWLVYDYVAFFWRETSWWDWYFSRFFSSNSPSSEYYTNSSYAATS